ncbi:DUF3368 domain-containing protein [Candidatus Thiothrix anitrata]|uniref:DUF3368 domain-containing protein n=1 Tax=Candidatus Thiothrix anitrata TaxID=2823902 RepID=A0ABX7X633_9GAMM|nr:DUF3368 domain-containing protein [Candidatus Thiothrix anitrata]QTR50732.1 DUF3368 domain-containing protein [Candidatus Thiothrix anitrata]
MKSIIVADTSPLIALAKLQQLTLLNSEFSNVHVPLTVLSEATRDMQRPDARLIRDFASKHLIVHEDADNEFCTQLRKTLDEGELQALHLARQLDCGVLIDEHIGRQVAQSYQIPVIGVLGILLKAKQSGAISAVAPLINDLLAQEYRLSKALIQKVLQAAGEI